MISSLTDICSRSICNGIAAGQLSSGQLQTLSRLDRGKILDWIHGNGASLSKSITLISANFLDGLVSKVDDFNGSIFDVIRALRDGVEEGHVRDIDLQQMHPTIRQWILDWVLAHGTIGKPECLAALGSVEFLRGMSSISTEWSEIDTGYAKYLRSLAESMRAEFKNGKTIGATITKLDLKIDPKYLRDVAQLIACCPNLESLGFSEGSCASFDIAILNQLDDLRPSVEIIENVKEFSLSASCLVRQGPRIEFKKLESLRLQEVRVGTNIWNDFLKSIEATLTSLRLDEVYVDDRSLLFPFPLPRLVNLEARDRFDPRDVYNMAECRMLKTVVLTISGIELFVASLDRLRVSVRERGSIIINVSRPNDVLDNLEMLQGLKDQIQSFDACNRQDLDGLNNAIGMCSNLAWIDVYIMGYAPAILTAWIPFFNDMAKAALVRTFTYHGRSISAEMQKLTLDIISLVTSNCHHLEGISIHECEEIRDHHLITLASNGVKLSTLQLNRCRNVTMVGVLAILKSSGPKLEKVMIVSTSCTNEPTDQVLRDYCPCLKDES